VAEHVAEHRAEHVAEHRADLDVTPRTSTLAVGLSEETTSETLPPLPLLPLSDSAWALLSYLIRVSVSRWRRHRIVSRVEASLRAESAPLDRLLADLGQYAYIEQVDLLALYPPEVEGRGGGTDEKPDEASLDEAALQAAAESWAARIDAEQLRTLAVLAREEARLNSDLLHCVEVRRQDAANATDPALQDEFEVLLGRLAAVRVERWVQERARSHCQRHAAQLLVTLQNLLLAKRSQTEARRLPNLLLLGGLLASQRTLSSTRAIEPWFTTVPGRPAGVQLSPALFQALWRYQDGLLPRAVLCARASVERFGYEEPLVKQALTLVLVILATVVVCGLIAWWALA
jgi:hypothetical protein